LFGIISMQMKIFFNYTELRREGYKLTPQRRGVIDILRRSSHHLSVDEIYLKVKKKYPRIGLTTVYRTLEVLNKLGWVRKCDFGERKARYELAENFSENNKHHHHVVCIQCNKVIDYVDFVKEETRLMGNTEKKIARKYDFIIKGHNIKFYGICKNCQRRLK